MDVFDLPVVASTNFYLSFKAFTYLFIIISKARRYRTQNNLNNISRIRKFQIVYQTKLMVFNVNSTRIVLIYLTESEEIESYCLPTPFALAQPICCFYINWNAHTLCILAASNLFLQNAQQNWNCSHKANWILKCIINWVSCIFICKHICAWTNATLIYDWC